ncbi:MAG: Ig-like domain-containing protein, partial [candidate division Zixibacteria bacterium]|nr:Ig-like domain-containing protein [candidate division Zixibacteria bacterium]
MMATPNNNGFSRFAGVRRTIGWPRPAMIIMSLLVAMIGFGCSGGDDGPSGPNPGPANSLSVGAMTPSDGTSGVSTTADITATFTRTVDPTTVTTSSFYVTGVAGSVTAGGTTATFRPSSRFDENRSYQVVITTDVRDTDGNALNQMYTWSFTTGITPAADAGPDQQVNKGGMVTLNGSSNLGSSATYTWTQIAGPSAGALSGANASFMAPDEVGTFVFELRVSEGSNTSDPDTTVVFALEDANNAYWVSMAGASGAAGTRTAPLASIQEAITMAATAGAGGDVYIAAGTYDESLVLAASVSLYGGYSAQTWMRDAGANTVTINGGTTAIRGVEASNVTIDGLTVRSADATTASGNSIAMSFARSTGVIITHNVIEAGAGFDGDDASRPGRPARANSGSDGGNAGSCIPSNKGGSGGSGSGRTGGSGGNGGAAGGSDGSGGTGPSGDGGKGGFASAGKTGTGGGVGSLGANATTSGGEFGSVASGIYNVANGAQGNAGGHGGGGGG